jgi:hypothetical protein
LDARLGIRWNYGLDAPGANSQQEQRPRASLRREIDRDSRQRWNGTAVAGGDWTVGPEALALDYDQRPARQRPSRREDRAASGGIVDTANVGAGGGCGGGGQTGHAAQ